MFGWFKRNRTTPERFGPYTAWEWYHAFHRGFPHLDGDPLTEVNRALTNAVGEDVDLSILLTTDGRDGVRVLATIKAGLEKRLDCEAALITALNDPSEPIRRTAAETLYRLGTVRGLAAVAVGDRHGHMIRTLAANRLSEFGPEAGDVIPEMFLLLTSGSYWKTQMAASRTLGSIGERAIPYLLHAIRYGLPHVRIEAARTLHEMGVVGEYKELIAQILHSKEDSD